MSGRITLLVAGLVLVASACGTTATDPTVAAVQPAVTTRATTRTTEAVDEVETFQADMRPVMLRSDLVDHVDQTADLVGDDDYRGAARMADTVVADLDDLLDAAHASDASDSVYGRSVIGALQTCRAAYSDTAKVLRGDYDGMDDATDELGACKAQLSLATDLGD